MDSKLFPAKTSIKKLEAMIDRDPNGLFAMSGSTGAVKVALYGGGMVDSEVAVYRPRKSWYGVTKWQIVEVRKVAELEDLTKVWGETSI